MYLDCRFKIGRTRDKAFSFLAAFARPAQGPRVDIPPPASVTGPLSGIECSPDKTLRVLTHASAVWNRSCVSNWYDRQLSENRFHWEHVKHLIIRPTFINDVGTAGQEPLCTKHLKLEQLALFRHIII
jgi:hypothetical protein